MNKILTIIIPTYNMEKYLRRCLDSLIIDEEGMKQLEVLVINDGSKDSSSQIAHEYQDKYPDTFRVIDKENGNYGSCVNVGISNAKGIFFRLLDADDWFDNEALRNLIRNMSNLQNVDIVATNMNVINVNELLNQSYQLKNYEYNKIYELNQIDISKCQDLMLMHCLSYKTSFIKSINLKLQTGISYTDTEYVYYPLIKATNIIFFDLFLYQYFLGREGQTVSQNISSKSIGDYKKVAERMLKNYLSYRRSCSENNIYHLNIGRVPLYNILRALLSNYLFYSNKDNSLEFFLRQSLQSIKSEDNVLYQFLINTKKSNIKYISLWYLFNIRPSEFPMSLYFHAIKLCKKFLY